MDVYDILQTSTCHARRRNLSGLAVCMYRAVDLGWLKPLPSFFHWAPFLALSGTNTMESGEYHLSVITSIYIDHCLCCITFLGGLPGPNGSQQIGFCHPDLVKLAAAAAFSLIILLECYLWLSLYLCLSSQCVSQARAGCTTFCPVSSCMACAGLQIVVWDSYPSLQLCLSKLLGNSTRPWAIESYWNAYACFSHRGRRMISLFGCESRYSIAITALACGV